MNKPRSDCRLTQLTHPQQAEVHRRLKTQSYAAVQRWLALPPPEGFGVKTHINSLARFFHRAEAERRFDNVLANLAANPAAFENVTARALFEASREVASSPQNLTAFSALSRLIFHRRDMEFRQQHLALQLEWARLRANRPPISNTPKPHHAGGFQQALYVPPEGWLGVATGGAD
jgi:hypothetical protein